MSTVNLHKLVASQINLLASLYLIYVHWTEASDRYSASYRVTKKKRRPFIKNENIPDLSSDDKKGIKSKMST